MFPGLQALWVSLSSQPDAALQVKALWWAMAWTYLAGHAQSVADWFTMVEHPPLPSLPPAADAVGTFRICPNGAAVTWAVPRTPRPVASGQPGLDLALSVSDTVVMPPLHIGASPPAGTGITQLPSGFWISGYDGSPIRSTTTRAGLSITMVSTPVSYTWDFGDGTQMSTTSLGVPGSGAAPITHTFTVRSAASPQAVGGDYLVRVTASFDTTFQIAGPTGTQSGDFTASGLAPLTDSATQPYEVDQVYGVLVPAPVQP